MAIRSIATLTVLISSIVISTICVLDLSFACAEELLLIHLDSRSGDIKKVEQKHGNGEIINKEQALFYPSQGLTRLYSFQYSIVKLLNLQTGGVAYCCPGLRGWRACHTVETVIAAIRYDQQHDTFSFSLNSMRNDKLTELEIIDFDPSRHFMRPLTRNYHLTVIKPETSGESEIWIIDESKEEVWR